MPRLATVLLLFILVTSAAAAVFDLPARKSAQWCWQPITHQTPPAVGNSKWIQSPIDQFILAKLEQKNLTPAAPADRRTLIRRAYFDLIGLPPPASDVDAFVNDRSPDAFAKVVDHLLASDHFGERWARHWMDVMRYAETRGHEFDPLIPNAWQYRDYLIRAFNADVPYNQLVTEQIAGDLLPNPRLNPKEGFNESILGTGCWFLGEEVHSPVDIRQDEADRMNNRIDTMTKAFFGLTVGCARCHDHKFDAISQKDFYALTGFAMSASYRQVPFKSMEQNRKVAEQLDALRAETRNRLATEFVSAERPGLNRVADYLSAAAEVCSSPGNSPGKVGEVAQSRSLDSKVLTEWVSRLNSARKDRSDILNAFATLAFDSRAAQPQNFAAARQRVIDSFAARNHSAADPAKEQVILDFDAPAPANAWYADGVAFGLRPVQAGQVLLGNTADQPIVGIAMRSMAMRDSAFNNLKATPGNETDYGTLGNWERSGQTLRTQTVTLKTGRLWYLVRGAGRAYAAVDSHLLVAGPLHGDLLREWRDERGHEWRWEQHDLTAYAGERCHVEFSPVANGELEIARVIDANQPPAIDSPSAAVESAIADPSVVSIDTMAQAYQKLLIATAGRMSAATIVGSADAGDQAALADFLVRNASLFGDSAAGTSSPAARDFIAAQSALAAKVIRQSPTAPAMFEGNGVDENVLIRGVAKNTGDVVPRRLLEAIGGSHQKPYPADGSGRLQLAQAMLADDDPFIARVMVNRVWQHLFGKGIVATVDNFGVLGQPPTHPQLLDYLSDHFRTEQGWSIKKLIRSIMLSSTYQMSSKPQDGSEEADPQNLTLNHMPIRRLEAEAIRDAILSVSGRLDPAVGGAPVEVHLTEFMEGRGRPGGSGPLDGNGRRSIYTRVRRNFLPPMMLAFDTPNPFACVGRRNVSNVPAQALILMNDPFVIDQAGLWAKHVLADPALSPKDRIVGMYKTALSREPRADEIDEILKFLDDEGAGYGLAPAQRMKDVRVWMDLCHVMFNMKEFVFVE
ncbi:MAG TPA: DUF1549 and DUF1553 domain-containing protein [Tepidisphaeraceae bacterium]|jgi:hypothetical protein|nr:DUF1549 and DUF1553 domain-containing protein [Tepidisphaeraceae bacterium]